MEWQPRREKKEDPKPQLLHSFTDFNLKEGVVIGVFQGSKGNNPDLDIVIKYINKKYSDNIRTPKHIHWVIDLFIKREHNKNLTNEFIQYLRDLWDKVEPFNNKKEQKKCELKYISKEEIEKYEELNNYGEYNVDFIAHIVELFMIEEKTGMEKAFMFKDLFDALLNEKDIFYVVSKATHKGKI